MRSFSFWTTFLLLSGCGVDLSECVPGKTKPCACEGTGIGVQVCAADGTFEACACDGACVPLTCDDLDATCGAPDDGCGGALACGLCDEPFECLEDDGAYVCGCEDDLVELDDTCDVDECEDGTADCGEHATCTNVVDGFECDCDDGFTGDGKYCAPDAFGAIQDVSAHPVEVEIDGIGTFEVGGLSSIGMRWQITRVTAQGNHDIPFYDTMEVPSVRMSRIAGSSGEIAALGAAASAGTPVDVLVRLRGVAGEVRGVTAFDARVVLVDDGTTVVGEDTVLGELRIEPVTAWELDESVAALSDWWSDPWPGEDVEIEGVLCCDAAHYAAGTLGFTNASRELHLPGIYDGAAAFGWFASSAREFDDSGSYIRRALSVIQLNGSGTETGRRNAFEGIPVEVRVFDATRPYFTTPLVTLTIAVGWAEDG